MTTISMQCNSSNLLLDFNDLEVSVN
uniref:Uncharacterized protein n=1 Tax=Arundo donax TaxID=35708 RepID=A0A0A9GFQ2_ARUDO